MPFDSNTWSPAPWPFSSIINPYWNPEQPPPCTNTRSPLPALFSSASSSLIFAAAVSDTLIIWDFSYLVRHYTIEFPCLTSRWRRPLARPATAQHPIGGPLWLLFGLNFSQP